MKILRKTGHMVAKKPWVSIMIVMLITLVALGSIISNGVDFAMDENDFTPNNPIIAANNIVGEEFSATENSISILRADNVFTKDAFLTALNYELSIIGDDAVSNYLVGNGSYANSITSPIKIISMAMTSQTDLETIIAAIESTSDDMIQTMAPVILSLPGMESISSLFTKDLQTDSLGKASASGAMIIASLDKAKIADNASMSMLDFEYAVDSLAKNASLPGSGITVQLLGEYMLIASMGDMANSDLGTLFPFALLAIVVILIFMYRDLVDMIISVLCLVLAVIWTFGFGLLAGIGISTVSMAIPILVLGLGIDYGLHLVFRYRERRMDGHDVSESSGYTLSTVGEALVLATLTTVVAFLSYQTSSMKMLADFGVLSALGIISSFIIMMMMIPAMQVLRDNRSIAKGIEVQDLPRYKDRKSDSKDYVGQISQIGGRAASAKPLLVLAITGIVLLGFGYGAMNVSYEFDMFDFLPDDSEGGELLMFIFDEFANTGVSNAAILIYGDATDPALIKAMESSIENMVDTENIIKEGGVVNAVYIGNVLLAANTSTMNSSYHALYPSYFNSTGKILDATTSSDVQTLIGLLTNEANPNIMMSLGSVIGNHQGDKITLIRVPISDSVDNDMALALQDSLIIDCSALSSLPGVSFVVTGAAISSAVVMEEMSISQMQSLLVTLAFTVIVLSLVMYYLYRSFVLGILATIPTLLSVVAVWGTMFLLGISLNVMTLTIAALTVGMGVTYGIHITHRFNAEIRDGLGADEAILRTTGQTGKGVLGAALTTSVGFAIIGFSTMLPMQQFGFITAIAILYSYLGASLVLPALLVLWGRWKENHAVA